MPELPEVETVRRALLPHIIGQQILAVFVHNRRLRYVVDEIAVQNACSQSISAVQRRSKYLILQTPVGFLLSHLGMSGSWKITSHAVPLLPHDHIQIDFAEFSLRYNDARRFGSFQWQVGKGLNYQGFEHLGVEPVNNPDFPCGLDVGVLKKTLAKKKSPIKVVLMDARIIVGIGNIYANEALFMAGIHPKKQACRISLTRLKKLCQSITRVLESAIDVGGTTLQNFIHPDNQTGYFQLSLSVYQRDGLLCQKCKQKTIRKMMQNQRSTFYCPHCQT